MFDHLDSGIGLWPGESDEEAAYRLTSLALADGWVDEDRHVLPDGLEEIPVGPYLAAIVSSVDPSRLNGHDAVRLMRAQARLSSHHEAGKLAAVAEVAYAPPGDPDSGVLRSSEEIEHAAVEVAAALCLTRRASEDELSMAVTLRERLVRVWEWMSAGVIDSRRMRVFDQMLGHLPDETVDQVLDRIEGEASGLTTGQLRARLSRLVLQADPDGSKSSYEEGLAERKVVVSSNPDHTANLAIYSAAPDRVTAARAHIESVARGLRGSGDTRTLDQLRNDVALDLLSGVCRHRPVRSGAGRVNVTIPASTLVRFSDEPGEFDGYGPVIAEIARKAVRENVDGEWVFTVTDNGRPVATGTLARRPTACQKRRVRADYPTCVWPGCPMPSYDCDLDHRRPHARGGPTHNDNLGPLCRHHHMVRHHSPWQLDRTPDGDHIFTSPLGHTYVRLRAPPG